MLNYQLQIVGDEFVTSIGHDDEFYVYLRFDRSIHRPMWTHMGYHGNTLGIELPFCMSVTITYLVSN